MLETLPTQMSKIACIFQFDEMKMLNNARLCDKQVMMDRYGQTPMIQSTKQRP
jgi:hypothetical protein